MCCKYGIENASHSSCLPCGHAGLLRVLLCEWSLPFQKLHVMLMEVRTVYALLVLCQVLQGSPASKIGLTSRQ